MVFLFVLVLGTSAGNYELPLDKFWGRLTKLGGMALGLMGEVLSQSRGPVPL